MRIFTLALMSAALAVPAQAATVSMTDDEFAVVDESFGFKDFTFTAGDFGTDSTITGVTLSVLFDKCDEDAALNGCAADGRPFADEIGFALIGPDGTAVSLVENEGGNELYETEVSFSFVPGLNSLENISILFDDDGASLGFLPASGTFAPEGALAAFNGLSGIGTWRFFFEDDAWFDELAIRSVTLNLETAGEATDVPAPGALGLLGLGILTLAARRRRA